MPVMHDYFVPIQTYRLGQQSSADETELHNGESNFQASRPTPG
jgi:hypothetical protein